MYFINIIVEEFGDGEGNITRAAEEKNIGDVCRQNEVDSCTFLTVVNFLTEETPAVINGIDNCLSVGSLITYLHNAHDYFLNFRLPHIRRKLTEAIIGCPGDIAFAITKFFDDYVYAEAAHNENHRVVLANQVAHFICLCVFSLFIHSCYF